MIYTKQEQKSSQGDRLWSTSHWPNLWEKCRFSSSGLLTQSGKKDPKARSDQAMAEIVRLNTKRPRYFTKQRLASAAIGSLMLFSSVTPALQAATITVDKAVIDANAGCDLEDAIETANADALQGGCIAATHITNGTLASGDPDTILFSTSPDTINLTAVNSTTTGPNGDNGLPIITSTITINGGTGGITLTRNSAADFRILEVNGIGSNAGKLTLEKMTIHNGKTNGPPGSFYSADGGGILVINNAALTLTNSIVVSNTANDDGGGVGIDENSRLMMYNSTIISNVTTVDGGGIFVDDFSLATVISSTIAYNVADDDGGGLFTEDDSPVTVMNSIIGSNTTAGGNNSHGGGIFADDRSPVTVTNSTIAYNIADKEGGGIYVRNDSPVTVVDSKILSNTAKNNEGGGIFAYADSPVTVRNSTIMSNTADSDGGGIKAGDDSPVTVISSTISHNTSENGDGGGIKAADRSPVTVDSSTIAYNRSNDKGGGFFVFASGTTTITNSLLLNNYAATQGGAFFFANSSGNKPATIKDSCIVNNSQDAVHNAETAIIILAQSNWWGTPDGAGEILTGAGDTVSTRVDGSNYRTTPILSCPTILTPGIEVSGNTIPILDGSTMPTVTDGTDFGSLFLGQSTVQTFIIENTATASLALTLPVALTGSPYFTMVAQPGAIALAPNITTSFQVAFTPTVPGLFTATLNISNTERDEHPYDFVLQGFGMVLDLHLSKTVTPTTVNPGDLLTYTLVVSNSGNINAVGTLISDTLPADLNFVGPVNLQGTTIGTTGIPPLLASGLTITAGERITLTFPVSVSQNAVGQDIVNTATVTNPQLPTVNLTRTGQATITVLNSNLQIIKSVTPSTIPGEPLTYTLIITNSGNISATGVTISDMLPTGLNYQTGSLTVAPASAGTTGAFPTILSNGIVTAGQAITLTFVTTGNFSLSGQSITNQATVTSTELATVIPNQMAAATAHFGGPELSIAKSAMSNPVNAGDLLTYQLVVRNDGVGPAYNVVISDTLPTNAGFNSVINSAGFTSNSGTTGVLAFLTPTLGAGTVYTLTFDVLVDPASSTDIINNVAITSTTPNSGNGPLTGGSVTTIIVAPPVVPPTPTFTPYPTSTPTPTPTATPGALVSLAPANIVIPEGGGTVSLNLQLNIALGVPVNVTLDSLIQLPDYATAALDYGAINQVITFAPGETSKIVTVNIYQDAVQEPNEQFQVIINAVSSGVAALAGSDRSLITILDDDVPTVTPTDSATPTATQTPLPADTVAPTVTPTATVIPTDTPLPTATAMPTDTPLPTATVVPTNTPLPTATAVPTDTPLPTATATLEPTATPIPLPEDTATPLPTATSTATDMATPVFTATNTMIPLPTETATEITTEIATVEPTATAVPLPVDTETPLPTALPTVTNTVTNTMAPVPTATATIQPTPTSLPTATAVPLPVETETPLPTALPTVTNSVAPVPTATVIVQPTLTSLPTETATVSPVDTVVPTEMATVVPTATEAATATAVPIDTPETPRQDPAVDVENAPIANPADVFDSAGPTPESVVQEADPISGEVNDSRLAGLIFKTQVRSEENSDDRNEVEVISLGGVAIFVISYENNGSEPLYGVVIRVVVPTNTTFRQAGSGPLPLAQVVAAGTTDEGDPPTIEQLVTAINQNRGTEWELEDLSGPCPDGASGGTACIFRLGTVQPGESGELSLPTIVNEDAPMGTRFMLETTLGAANLDEGLLITISDEAGIETVDTTPVDNIDTPTDLDQEEEPLWRKLFLPFVSR